MPSVTLRSSGVRFQGYRPCAARDGWVELLVRVDGRKVSWCVPLEAGTEDETTPAGPRLTIRWAPTSAGGIQIEETDAAGVTRGVTAARALSVLAEADATLLALDDRLAGLSDGPGVP